MGLALVRFLPRPLVATLLAASLALLFYLYCLSVVANSITSHYAPFIHQQLTTTVQAETGLTLHTSVPSATREGIAMSIAFGATSLADAKTEEVIVSVPSLTVFVSPLSVLNPITIAITGATVSVDRNGTLLTIADHFTVNMAGEQTGSLEALGAVPFSLLFHQLSVRYRDLGAQVSYRLNPDLVGVHNSASKLTIELHYRGDDLPLAKAIGASVSLDKKTSAPREFSLHLQEAMLTDIARLVDHTIPLSFDDGAPQASLVLYGYSQNKNNHQELVLNGELTLSQLGLGTGVAAQFRVSKYGERYALRFPTLSVEQQQEQVVSIDDMAIEFDCCDQVTPVSLTVRSMEAAPFSYQPFFPRGQLPDQTILEDSFFVGTLSHLAVAFEDGIDSRLSLGGQVAIEEFQVGDDYYLRGIDATFSSTPGNVRISLQGSSVEMRVFELFPRGHYADSFSAVLRLSSEQGKFRMVSEPIGLVKDGNRIDGLLSISYQPGLSPYMRLALESSRFDGPTGVSLIPIEILNPALTDWLAVAIKDGNTTDFTLSYAGNLLYDLPVAGPEILSIYFDFDALALRYQPQWPMFKNMKGSFYFSDNKLTVAVAHAEADVSWR